MESNGWFFDLDNSMDLQEGTYHDDCGGDTWYGWTAGNTVGSIRTVLEGFGIAVVKYGNCFNKGQVKLYLNDDLVSSANANVRNKIAKFLFSDGDVLKINENAGIIKLNFFEIKCTGKYYVNI